MFCGAYHRDRSGGSDLPGEEEHCTLVTCKELLLNAEILKIDLYLLLGFTFSQNKRLQPGETALNCPFGNLRYLVMCCITIFSSVIGHTA